MFLKNVSGQKVGAQMITAADGTAFTGSVTVAVTIDAGTQATGSVSSGACTHEGNGYHTYAPAQAETNGELVAFTFTGTGAIPVTNQVYTLPTTGVLSPATLGRTAVVDAAGLIDSTAVKLGPSGSGTAQTARDIGASVLLSSGTGTGQVSLSSGQTTPVASAVRSAIGMSAANMDSQLKEHSGAMLTGSVTSVAGPGEIAITFDKGTATSESLAGYTIVFFDISADAYFVAKVEGWDGSALTFSNYGSYSPAMNDTFKILPGDAALARAAIATKASQASVDTIDGIVDTLKVVSDKLATMLAADGGNFKYTSGALQESPAGGEGTPAQVHNEDPVPAFTAKLGTRADGVTRAFPVLKLTLTKTNEAHIWIDCSRLLSGNIEDVTAGESDLEAITIKELGMYGKFVSIVLDTSGATVGDTAIIACKVKGLGPVAVNIVIKSP